MTIISFIIIGLLAYMGLAWWLCTLFPAQEAYILVSFSVVFAVWLAHWTDDDDPEAPWR